MVSTTLAGSQRAPIDPVEHFRGIVLSHRASAL